MSESYFESFSNETIEWFRETLGEPTPVQKHAWPEISKGNDVLISAPTGTGKTLSAFLVFVDRYLQQAKSNDLEQELQLIYLSPLKSLAGDIRENLQKPKYGILERIKRQEENTPRLGGSKELHIMIRTGDTSQSERRSMIKKPPHILITTPESLFLMLSSKSGKEILKTAKTVIIDELHALIDTKRGAHLMLSLSRLEILCQHKLQRIGLSATIDPLSQAASYLSDDDCKIVAPKMEKKVEISIINPHSEQIVMKKDHLWREIATVIYDHSLSVKSGIVFCDGRAFVERIAYQINQIGGEGYARTHHGSLSKEQRQQAEMALRRGELKLLCATSSMELGIDVGDIDLVYQIGCPKSIASTMQRLGRAGHNPGKISYMEMYPRSSMEAIYCAMTARVAKEGGIEQVKPPRLCLDILAQHLVSMAATEEYSIASVLHITKKAYPFRKITEQQIKEVLCMLSGDYEHDKNQSFRPRILYDRIHDTVFPDSYSRLLAVSAGGTIPDKGLYTVKTEQGLKIGEVDEEFVFESKVGDRFLLGSFSWQIQSIQRDNVVVKQSGRQGARAPFYKAENYGRNYQTGLAFGKMLGEFQSAYERKKLQDVLVSMSMDDTAASNGVYQIGRQLELTGILPTDQVIILEHFKDDTGSKQLMVHSVFGKKINSPLSLLLREQLKKHLKTNVNTYEDDDGILLFPYGDYEIPEGLLFELLGEEQQLLTIRETLEALLPSNPLFHMTFRYNAARALMMGVKNHQRQPLWIQRLKSAQLLDTIITYPKHPLIMETKRECLEDLWDLDGLIDVLKKIKQGNIQIVELFTETPSPFSLPLRRQTEAVEMYNYTPIPQAVHGEVIRQLELMDKRKAAAEHLRIQGDEKKAPESEHRFHGLLMEEGDFQSVEINVPKEWLNNLLEQGRITYIEPGLWIAKEQETLYEAALFNLDRKALTKILLRSLKFRGGQTLENLQRRYLLDEKILQDLLLEITKQGLIIKQEDYYYEAEAYEEARKYTILQLRNEIQTVKATQYAGFLLEKIHAVKSQEEAVEHLLKQYQGIALPTELLESGILQLRLPKYRETMLDEELKKGFYYWKYQTDGRIQFLPSKDIDWDTEPEIDQSELSEDENKVYQGLRKRGACLLTSLQNLVDENKIYEVLLSLITKGLVTADSFLPVRHILTKAYDSNKSPKQRALVKTKAKDMIYFQIVRNNITKTDQIIEKIFDSYGMITKETMHSISFSQALTLLRMMEYTGQVRRGYYVEGMSGIQFIRDTEFERITSDLKADYQSVFWMVAQDPFQPFGNLLPVSKEYSFSLLSSTLVGYIGGTPSLLFEKNGKVLRILSTSLDISQTTRLIQCFVAFFDKKKVLDKSNRIKITTYPKELEALLIQCGFQKEIKDLIYYRNIQIS